MRYVRALGGVAVAALLACGAITASASAEVPEIGRCSKVEKVEEGKRSHYHGGYKNKNCTRPSAGHNGKYEWTPGPGTNNKFSGIADEPEPVLETTGGEHMECSVMELHGEYTGPKTEKEKVSFGGCQIENAGKAQPCETIPVKEGDLETLSEFEGELGVVKSGAKPVVGWDLKNSGSGPLYTYVCAAEGEVPSREGTIEGSVIGTLAKSFAGSDINKMSIYSDLEYKQSKGLQDPESFEGQPADVLSTKLTIGLTTTTEQTGLETNLELTSGKGEPIEKPENQEPLEVKTVE
jgi:hypothetical protein